jgi:kynureninase
MPAEFVPQRGAAGWGLSNAPVLPMAALAASLELFDAVGMEALRARSEALTGALLEGLGDLPEDRLWVLTPREASARGCQVSLRAPRDGRAIFGALEAGGVVCDFREPDVIRMAPVPLYNTSEDVWRVVEVIHEALRA